MGAFPLVRSLPDRQHLTDAASFEANPCTLTAAQKAIFAGAYKLRDGVIVRLEPELLRPSRLAEIQFPGLGIRTAAGVA